MGGPDTERMSVPIYRAKGENTDPCTILSSGQVIKGGVAIGSNPCGLRCPVWSYCGIMPGPDVDQTSEPVPRRAVAINPATAAEESRESPPTPKGPTRCPRNV